MAMQGETRDYTDGNNVLKDAGMWTSVMEGLFTITALATAAV